MKWLYFIFCLMSDVNIELIGVNIELIGVNIELISVNIK
jgi:hypothetical protein